MRSFFKYVARKRIDIATGSNQTRLLPSSVTFPYTCISLSLVSFDDVSILTPLHYRDLCLRPPISHPGKASGICELEFHLAPLGMNALYHPSLPLTILLFLSPSFSHHKTTVRNQFSLPKFLPSFLLSQFLFRYLDT